MLEMALPCFELASKNNTTKKCLPKCKLTVNSKRNSLISRNHDFQRFFSEIATYHQSSAFYVENIFSQENTMQRNIACHI